jgi:hypothetical protein
MFLKENSCLINRNAQHRLKRAELSFPFEICADFNVSRRNNGRACWRDRTHDRHGMRGVCHDRGGVSAKKKARYPCGSGRNPIQEELEETGRIIPRRIK